MKRAPALLTSCLVASLSLLSVACGARQRPLTAVHGPEDQVAFGIRMAQRGLWSEALFRFERAYAMERRTAGVLNNLAVACEALGRFDDALGYYREALALEPGNRDLKSNYDRFVSFYEAFRAREEKAAPAAGSEEDEARPMEPEPPTGREGGPRS